MRVLAVGVALGCVLAGAAPAAAAPPAGPDPASIDEIVRAHVGATRLPGVAVAVVDDDRIVHAAGYGHDSTGEPVTEHTPVRLGGVSESFTAVALAQLVGFGVVRFDDPVVAHLPGFTTADPRSGEITVRRLLDHTSGLPPAPAAPRTPARSLEEAVAGLRDVALVAAPGERRVRSGLGYQVAARLVEVKTGRPFDAFLTERVLFQVGAQETTTVAGTRDLVDGLVDGHTRFLAVSRPQAEPERLVSGSEGVVSTAADVGTWLQFNVGWGLRTVLAGDGLREVQRLGCQERPGGELVLRGRTATSAATLVMRPGRTPDERWGVAVLANGRDPLARGDGAAPSEVDDLADELAALVRGETPAPPGPPVAFLVELLLTAAAVGALVVAAVAVLRSRRWARATRPWAGRALRLAPYALPLVLLAFLPDLAAPLVGGAATFADLAALWPTALVAAEVAAAAGAVVVAARLYALARPGAVSAPAASPRTGP
ncbi:MAG TPA: serine hydrolase domain-containing protein [Pseudonocardia sp.]|uniref:serine hydrolase domain-containing protein n=1 Tax=Pseudonocardia sp. TaxID=60912 RepID=UPI002B4B6097|nr:serine hydrolase domain-containing protein [Pseudonocardia sp.]HLU57548.1 serine hydrolase domain-containing protein [Pseudonocardia sp.]